MVIGVLQGEEVSGLLSKLCSWARFHSTTTLTTLEPGVALPAAPTAPAPRMDRDGDTIMSVVLALSTKNAQIATLTAVTAQVGALQGGVRPVDVMATPPAISMDVRRQRLTNGHSISDFLVDRHKPPRNLVESRELKLAKDDENTHPIDSVTTDVPEPGNQRPPRACLRLSDQRPKTLNFHYDIILSKGWAETNHKRNWDLHLPSVAKVSNSHYGKSVGFSPVEVLYH
ncbi:hypothetical protein E4U30_001168, partial [Claviceps sp. LM220 group G6]